MKTLSISLTVSINDNLVEFSKIVKVFDKSEFERVVENI